MPIKHSIWKVGEKPTKLADATLQSERLLEDMIVSTPSILSDEWMLIGRQENTGFSGRIDLLAIAPDGSLVLIEIKRNRTPREVVAQALDYASWVEILKDEDIAAIYKRFKPDGEFKRDFKAYFGAELDEDSLNDSHQIVIVAASLDDSSERIVSYLNNRNIAINVLVFQVFAHGSEQLISRAWLLDPIQTQTNTSSGQDREKEPWNGEFYFSFGEDANRSWEEAVQYGFVSAGGGTWYSRTLQLLHPGDRIWVNTPGKGYAGVGKVTGEAQFAGSFMVQENGQETRFMEIAKANYLSEFIEDPEKCEYFVPVEWIHTVPLKNAVREIGFFGNQNSVCKPTSPKWRHTVERLKERFQVH
jgi:hypothetical protein